MAQTRRTQVSPGGAFAIGRIAQIFGARVTVVASDGCAGNATERAVAALRAVARVAIVAHERGGLAQPRGWIAGIRGARIAVIANHRAVAAASAHAAVGSAGIAVVAVRVVVASTRREQWFGNVVTIVGTGAPGLLSDAG